MLGGAWRADVRLGHRVTRVAPRRDGRARDRGARPGGASEVVRRRRRRLEHPAVRARPLARPAAAGRRRRGGPAAALSRPPRRRADLDRSGAVPGQLDLPPRSGHAGRAGAELRRLEPRDDPARLHVPRSRVLLLPGRRDVVAARSRARRAREAGAREDRPDRPGARRRRRRDPGSARVSDVRQGLRRCRRDAPRPHRVDPEPADRRPQRPPSLQQPGPLDVDGGARDAEPARRRRATTSGPSTPTPSIIEEGELPEPARRAPRRSLRSSSCGREQAGRHGRDRRQLVDRVQADAGDRAARAEPLVRGARAGRG